jgi:hypothetical protein
MRTPAKANALLPHLKQLLDFLSTFGVCVRLLTPDYSGKFSAWKA